MPTDERAKTTKRYRYITVLTVISAFAVVILHTNGVFWDFGREHYWMTANVIESVFYFAVPVFLMISGATLIDYRDRYSTRVYFVKRAQRVLIPYVFWLVMTSLWHFYRADAWPATPIELVNGLLNNSYNTDFSFFSGLIGVYLVIPLLGLVPKDQRRLWFGYAIVLRVALSSTTQIAQWIGVVWPPDIQLPYATGFALYALIGYWLAHYEISGHQAACLYVAGACGLAVHMLGTQELSFAAGQIDMTFKGYLNLPCVFYSSAVFVVARRAEATRAMELLYRLCEPFAGLTLGVYLVQRFVLDIAGDLAGADVYRLWYRTVGAAAIFLVCAGVTWLLKRVPLIQKTLG